MMKQVWAESLRHDPTYNWSFSLAKESLTLCTAPSRISQLLRGLE
ncbi:hypothetical protein SAMN02743940_2570 [Nitrosomonas cryotolerans ATCC 49181]|uniref:Uncharacterized protein n=1 Tax=Nitrosomonas cryotolerans ATCC 49181 TaxID=1131553 RepID=A0A1N6JFA7_9PROT|nr:hypothetical protein SAMN02743940_2570 [Nitrosomonas cryotolerans ATCC 49181]